MNSSFMLLFANLTSFACVITAAYLASKGVEGWGWFLFAGVMCTQYFKSSGS